MLKEIDSDSTLEELNKALYSLASSKAPEKDRILAEVLKCCKRNIISWVVWNPVSAEERVKYHRTWGMQTSSHSTRTKAIKVTTITTVASPSLPSFRSFSPSSTGEAPGFGGGNTQNCNVFPEPTGQPLIWCSPSDSSNRNVGNNGNHSSQPS